MLKYKALSKELSAELKKEMQYTEKTQECRECGCYKKIDGQIDGERVDVCTLNAIGHLQVKPAGHCIPQDNMGQR